MNPLYHARERIDLALLPAMKAEIVDLREEMIRRSRTEHYQTMAIVLAHGKAQAAVDRHLPEWRKNAGTIVFFTPCNDRLDTCYPQYSIGDSDAYSPSTNERTRAALRFASYADVRYVLLIEYDSLVFGEIPKWAYPEPYEITCPRFKVEPGGWYKGGEDGGFKGSQFLHFPILMSIQACRKIADAMDGLPLFAEGGLTDRYVGLAAELAGVKIKDLWESGIVYTHNRITSEMIPEAVQAIERGARWSHGIKDEDVYRRMSEAADRLPKMPT